MVEGGEEFVVLLDDGRRDLFVGVVDLYDVQVLISPLLSSR